MTRRGEKHERRRTRRQPLPPRGLRLDLPQPGPKTPPVARISLQQVRKSFEVFGRSVLAVAGVDLEVETGELLALVGPSGSGKTTLLRLIAGLETPDAGVIRLDDEVVNSLPPERRGVGMVFQRDALFPHLSAGENLALGLRLRGLGRAEIQQRVDELAAWLELGDCLERRPEELSGGERQRVALGRALALRPRVLLLDEPLVHLDAPLRRQLRRLLLRLHRELHLTMLWVTHDPAEARALGQRVAVMRRGIIEQVGSPDQLRARPASPFVADFLRPDLL